MSGRGKSKGQHAFPGDFIALGSKAGSSKVGRRTGDMARLVVGCILS